MPNAERLSASLQAINEGGIRLQPSAYTPWLEQQAVIVASDPTVPNAPTLAATAAVQAIDLALAAPETNTDGSAYLDHKKFVVFYSPSPGINVGDPLTYSGTFETTSTQHTYATESQTYFRAVCRDLYGNTSTASPEVNAVPDTADTPVSVDDYTNNIANVYVGAGMIGIEFQPPKASWVRFAAWQLYFDANTGVGWSGSWTACYRGAGPGFLHKGLNESHKYKYRLRVLGEDGTETTGTVSDNNGAGYQPNAADNSALVAVTIFAERIVASKEMVARTFIGGKLQSSNWGTLAGTQFDLDNATLRLGGSSSPKLSWDGTALTLVGSITVTGGSVPYSVVTGGPPTNADNTKTIIDGGLITTGEIQLQDGGGVARAGMTAAGTGDANVRIWAGVSLADRATAPFRVTQGGAVTATNATITGTITASAGTIGGFTIGSTALTAGSGGTAVGLAPGSFPFYAGSSTASSAPFRVTSGGAVTCTNITITGGSVAGSTVGSGITADNVTAGTLTGRTVRTAASGARAEMNIGGGYGHQFSVYDSSVIRASLGAGYLFAGDSGGNTRITIDGTSSAPVLGLFGSSFGTLYSSADLRLEPGSTSHGVDFWNATTRGSNPGTINNGLRIKVNGTWFWVPLVPV